MNMKQHSSPNAFLFTHQVKNCQWQSVRRTVKLAVYALHILAVCDHSMLTASSSGQHAHLVSLRFSPHQPSIYCAVPIRNCISICMEYINQVCIWSISTLSLVGPFINHTLQHLHHWLNQTASSRAFIISLCSYHLLCNCTGAILPVCRYTTL